MVQLVVPMSGLGSRFAERGYADPKPLIKVHGKPMIEWVLNMFPGLDKPVFVCRESHLRDTHMRETLESLAPEGTIVSTPGAKLGPVDAVMRAASAIDDAQPVLVSYCDYYMHWDMEAFLQATWRHDCHGAIPCYSGFHPHLIPERNVYASCAVDENESLLEIREKYSFAADKTRARHSPGVYWFRSGKVLKHYFQRYLEEGPALNGEYYVSLVYNLMLRDGLNVWAPVNVSRFCQWGTPEDLREHESWIRMTQEVA